MIEMVGVNKYFGMFHVLKDVDLAVSRGEKVVVCGPSGSGKSTLIRLVNRLEVHQAGRVVVDGIELDDLVMLGPINVHKLKFTPGEFGHRLVAELWTYPDGSRLLELSTKCGTNEAFEVTARTRVFLASHGIDLLAEQQTKTKTALEFFARELAETAETA